MKTCNQEKSASEKGIQKDGANPIIVGNVGIGSILENCHRNGRVYHHNRENDRRCGQGLLFIPLLWQGCTDASRPAKCKPNRRNVFGRVADILR